MDQRFLQVAELIAAQPQLPPDAHPIDRIRRLCCAAVAPLRAAGTVVTVMGEGLVRGMVAGSDPRAERLEDLQFTTGEGPGVDAFADRRPVLIPDLSTSAVTARWPGYAAAAQAQGARAVFAFPLQIGASRLGVLDVVRDQPVMLSDTELRLALTFAEVAMSSLVNDAAALTPDGDGMAHDDLFGGHAEVFQAQGMVTGQLGVNLTDALARMRAHAYLHDVPLAEIAADIVAGRLRLEPQQT